MTSPNTSPLPAWVQDVGRPLPERSCGDDPRYLDEFQMIKEELDRLRGVDYSMVQSTSRSLLTQTTKDLRVAAYHLIAATYVDGLAGLVEGLQAYRALLENFWEPCHPQSETGRLGALALLNNPRILAFAEQQPDVPDPDTLQILEAETNWINRFLVDRLGEEAPRLITLSAWVNQQADLRRQEAPSEPPPDADTSTPVAAAPQSITSEHDLARVTQQLHAHLCKTGDLTRALGYSRAFRWGSQDLPPHEDGKTRIPAPRAGGITDLHNMKANEPPEAVFRRCEELFFEPGFHLLFDLQHLAFQAAEGMNRPELASMVRSHLTVLLQRQPGLIDLTFDDGTPFAQADTRQWLRQGEDEAGASMPAAPLVEEEDEALREQYNALREEARHLARDKKLAQGLKVIGNLPARTERQRVYKGLEEAQLCLTAGKAFMAESLLAELQQRALSHHLQLWDPALALALLQQRIEALRSLKNEADTAGEPCLAQTMAEVRRQICQIDIAAAARII